MIEARRRWVARGELYKDFVKEKSRLVNDGRISPDREGDAVESASGIVSGLDRGLHVFDSRCEG